VRLLLTGLIGERQVSVGNYVYETTSTSTSTGADGSTSTTTTTHTHHLIVVVVPVHDAAPSLTLHQRGAVSRLGRRIFGDPATATGHEEFDRRFRIESMTPDAARAQFGPRLIAAQLAGEVPVWSLHNGTLLTYQQGRIKDPAMAPGFAAGLVRVANLLGR
jgi:hypothetical protein